MDDQPILETLYPGAVTAHSGYYRVVHSSAHRPVTETFIFRDFHLPDCGMPGCVVSFQLVQIGTGGVAHKQRDEAAN